MDAFSMELKERLPLAGATLELFDFALDPGVLDSIYHANRGRCYEDVLTFGRLVSLVRDALTQHDGSGHKLFVELEREKAHPVDESNFYRKLAKTPVAVSRALLRDGTARLRPLVPAEAMAAPSCFDAFELVVMDGKKIKNAAKRLAPTRGYTGKLLGAKALVALDARRGLAIAMSDSLDGEANDVPLVPALLPQVRLVITQRVLWLADRQFCDPATLCQLQEREGDRFVVRVRRGLHFQAESTRTMIDEQGRTVIDEVGVLGRGKQAMRLRRVTLLRPGDDDVIVLTDLLDQEVFAALNLLQLYRRRWSIEQVFQEVTQTFALAHLIGSSPKAVLFQFAFCLLLYNLVQVVKSFVAADGAVRVAIVSTFGLFYDIKRELTTWAYLGDGEWTRTRRDAAQMRQRLSHLLRGSWDAVAYTKASDKKPRPKPPPRRRLHGGHTSVQRLLNQAAQQS